MKSSIFSLRLKLSLAALFLAGFAFFGCKPEISNTNPTLFGKWVDSYSSVYEISTSTFKNYGEGWTGYEGNSRVVAYTNDEETEGYIYIKYTKAYESTSTKPTEDEDTWTHSPANEDWGTTEYWYRYSSTAPDVGKWYAIAFKGLTESALQISGAYGTKSSTDTLDEAIEEFTIDNGYFGTYSACSKQ
ncbi:MAG: hypothetical protein K5829_13000 [Treponema sp.]|nr:hypothetical protein [Treponema sp.]